MPSKRKRRRVLVFACFILLAGFLWLLPTIIAKSAIRDLVLNSIANAPSTKYHRVVRHLAGSLRLLLTI